jgi:mRNA interferase MazF
MMRRGDVWRVRFGPPRGHAQAGERPAVIVQHDRFTSRLSTLVVIPFTSRLKLANFPGTLLIQPDGRNGLTVPSVALGFQVRAVDQRDVLAYLGILDAATLDQVAGLLQTLTR